MEERKSIFSTLNSIDFDEWVNIPNPLVQTLVVFKECFAEQSRKISGFYVDLDKVTEKFQFKIRSLNEIIANTNELIQNQQESIMKKVKERGEFLRNDVNALKTKINDENMLKQRLMNESLCEMKEKVEKCVKIVNSLMTPEEVSQAINEKSTSLHISICSEIRDQLLKPISDKLLHEIKSVNDKSSKGLESTNHFMKNLERTISLTNEQFTKTINELQKEDENLSQVLKISQKNTLISIEDTNKKFENLQYKTTEIEKSFNTSLQKHTKNFDALSHTITKLSEKFSAFETQQQILSNTITTNVINSSPDIQKPSEKLFSQILESELFALKSQISEKLDLTKKEVLQILQQEISSLESKLTKSKSSIETVTAQIQDKLSWLPLNLSEIKGMPPSDARLFTIEARLRAEENSRIQALTTIEKSLETLKRQSITPMPFKGQDRRTPELKQTKDRLIRFSEHSKERNHSHIMDGLMLDNYEGKKTRNKKSLSKIVFS